MSSLAENQIPFPAHRSGIPMDMSDAEAVRGVIAGNRDMFEVIVRRYNTQLYRIGMAYLRDHAQSEDAMQNAYLKAFLNLRRFHGNSAFATWLTRIMINECLMILRSKKRFIMETIDDNESHSEIEDFAIPAPEVVSRHDIKAILEQTIQSLPRVHRAVYLMRDVQQLSIAETAKCLGMSTANVKVSLHRAREGMKAELLKSAAGVELFEYSAKHCDPMTARVMAKVRTASKLR
jgi:RNA polymerase sigma-70 factor (ECF subfamily)